MTADIMDAILSKLNRQFSCNGRGILLLMDNAGCHPDNLATKYSNIEVCFLPANTTSKLQPLDLGIIKNFKFHCRRLLLRYVLSKIEECSTASDVIKSVNILVAIRWVATALGNVKEEVVKKCFRKAGSLDSSFEVVTGLLMADDEDPFSEVDDQVKDNMQSLIERTMPADRQCSVEEYLMGDDDLPICTNLDCATWEDNFLSQLGDGDPAQQEEMDSEDNKADNDEDNANADVPNIQSFTEAIKSLEDVQEFLERRVIQRLYL